MLVRVSRNSFLSRTSVITITNEFYIDDDDTANGPLTRTLCPVGYEPSTEGDDHGDLLSQCLFPIGMLARTFPCLIFLAMMKMSKLFSLFLVTDNFIMKKAEEDALDVADLEFYGLQEDSVHIIRNDLGIDIDEKFMQDHLELEFGVAFNADDLDSSDEDHSDADEHASDELSREDFDDSSIPDNFEENLDATGDVFNSDEMETSESSNEDDVLEESVEMDEDSDEDEEVTHDLLLERRRGWLRKFMGESDSGSDEDSNESVVSVCSMPEMHLCLLLSLRSINIILQFHRRIWMITWTIFVPNLLTLD